MLDVDLIAGIYEAAASPTLWPTVLHDISRRAGAVGAMFVVQSTDGLHWTASPGLQRPMEDYVAGGWMQDGARTAPLIHEQYPGFRCETDYRSVVEIESLPCYRDFLKPNGFIGGTGTVFQGVADDALHLGVEAFGGHRQAADAVPFLNSVRPHIGRALSLSAKLRKTRTDMLVAGLEAMNVAAAVVHGDGRLRSHNASFAARLGDRMIELRGRLRFAERALNDALDRSLSHRADPAAASRSIVVRDIGDALPFVLHVLPTPGISGDLFDTDGVLLIVADGANRNVPNADVLRMLFDLTPAEARLARSLLEGHSLAQAAAKLNIVKETARVQLRGVFAKTGTRRQAQLVQLLSGFLH